MLLRLTPQGAQVVDEWLTQRCKSPDDEQLIADVLRTIANRSWQVRWRSYKNETEPDVTTIQPRDGLFIHVRLWADEAGEFTVVAITELEPIADE
jgi:hypothetical protein